MTPTSIVAYLLLFAGGAFLFLFVTLLLGWLLRHRRPSPTKLATYECGEPAVGTSYLQFDLRFYVVALVFLIFEVEVAFFFPWAVVFGTANQITALTAATPKAPPHSAGLSATSIMYAAAIVQKENELGIHSPAAAGPVRELGSTAKNLAWAAMLDMAVFFVVLLVGFAYVWNQGDLDWVRATSGWQEDQPAIAPSPQSSWAG